MRITRCSGRLRERRQKLWASAAPRYFSPLHIDNHLNESKSIKCWRPPGTGKTYTAARVIDDLLSRGRTVGVTSNGHKAIDNLLKACGEQARENGKQLVGVKVGSSIDEELQAENPEMVFIEKNADARANYAGGVIGGTAWLFTLDEWEDKLDYLFIDEAGQGCPTGQPFLTID